MYKHFSHVKKKTKTKKNKSQKHILTSINHSTIIQNTANVTKLKFKIFQNKIPPPPHPSFGNVEIVLF